VYAATSSYGMKNEKVGTGRPLAQHLGIIGLLEVLLQGKTRKCKVPAGGSCQNGTLELDGVVKALLLAGNGYRAEKCYRMQHLDCQDKRDDCNGRL